MPNPDDFAAPSGPVVDPAPPTNPPLESAGGPTGQARSAAQDVKASAQR